MQKDVFFLFSIKKVIGFCIGISRILFFRRFWPKMVQNWSLIRWGWSQTPPRHFWSIFAKIDFFNNKTTSNTHETSAGRKTDFFENIWKSKRRASKFRFVWRAGQLPIFYFDPIRDNNVKWAHWARAQMNGAKSCIIMHNHK